MTLKTKDYHRFQHDGWQRAAVLYDTAWRGLCRPFAYHLVDALGDIKGKHLLDAACGPGYAAEAAFEQGAIPLGVDFSGEMIRIAGKRLPEIRFCECNAQALAFEDDSFDAVTMNFGLPHMSDPRAVFLETKRVLKSNGIFGFTVWARPDENPGAGIVYDALQAHADPAVQIPQGPDYFIFDDPGDCRKALIQAGFNPDSIIFRSVTVNWKIISPSAFFESERHAGVRTSAILEAQNPENLNFIKKQIEASVRLYQDRTGFAIPFTANIVTVTSG